MPGSGNVVSATTRTDAKLVRPAAIWLWLPPLLNDRRHRRQLERGSRTELAQRSDNEVLAASQDGEPKPRLWVYFGSFR